MDIEQVLKILKCLNEKGQKVGPKVVNDSILNTLFFLIVFAVLFAYSLKFYTNSVYQSFIDVYNVGIDFKSLIVIFYKSSNQIQVLFLEVFILYIILIIFSVLKNKYNKQREDKYLAYTTIIELVVVSLFFYISSLSRLTLLFFFILSIYHNTLFKCGDYLVSLFRGERFGLNFMLSVMTSGIFLFVFLSLLGFFQHIGFHNDIERIICSTFKVKNFNTSLKESHMGWLIAENDKQFYIMAKSPQGIYQKIILNKDKIVSVTDFSKYTFSKELLTVFEECI